MFFDEGMFPSWTRTPSSLKSSLSQSETYLPFPRPPLLQFSPVPMPSAFPRVSFLEGFERLTDFFQQAHVVQDMTMSNQRLPAFLDRLHKILHSAFQRVRD